MLPSPHRLDSDLGLLQHAWRNIYAHNAPLRTDPDGSGHCRKAGTDSSIQHTITEPKRRVRNEPLCVGPVPLVLRVPGGTKVEVGGDARAIVRHRAEL